MIITLITIQIQVAHTNNDNNTDNNMNTSSYIKQAVLLLTIIVADKSEN